jgi:hypothetical protein
LESLIESNQKKRNHVKMAVNGGAHKFLSVILRVIELACGGIVIGLLGHFTYILSDYDAHADGRIIYAMVVAGLAVIYSFFFLWPFDVLFRAFPIDFIFSIMWLVAFALLANVGILLMVDDVD